MYRLTNNIDTVRNSGSGQIASIKHPVYRQFHEICLHFGILHLVLEVDLLLFSQQIWQLLCVISRIYFPHLKC